jgi:RNA polymerase sigma-70 factor (ECF subfamily)
MRARMQILTAGTHVLSDASDEQLAERAAADFEAFEELYRRYIVRMYRFLRSQTPDDATAEDLTAQVFFKALSSAASFRGDGSYKSWIFRIAHNTLSTWRSRRGRALTVEQVPEKVDPGPTPVSHAIAREERDLVWEEVEALPAAQQEVITLHYAEDLSIEEVARVTKRTRGAVRILLHRARNRLRHALEGRDLQ